MKVTLIAKTVFEAPAPDTWAPHYPATGPDALVEFSGRACYQSWNRPNPKTATNEGYLKNILDQKHESVLEHASATFYVEGVSRSLTHELIRHRHLSYSELSQRYVNVAQAEIVEPPAIRDLKFADESWTDVGEAFEDAASGRTLDFRGAYTRLVKSLEDEGLSRKKAREAARSVMPNMIETKIVVTGNMRAWRDMLKKRWHVAADAEIREFAGEILVRLREIAPNSFQDIPKEPYE